MTNLKRFKNFQELIFPQFHNCELDNKRENKIYIIMNNRTKMLNLQFDSILAYN